MDTPDPITSPAPASTGIIVLFDGVCNLCNGAVQFIIRHNRRGDVRFASLQSAFGQAQLVRHALDPQQLHSMIVLHNGRLLQRSDAALEIARHLDAPWRALKVLRFVPRFVRDAAYNLVARTRYKIFGRTDQCMIPTPGLRARFVD